MEPSERAPAEPPPPMFTEAQIRRLKVAVIGMGLVLVLGFLAVIGRIVYLVSRPSASTDRPAPPAAVKADVTLPLPAGAIVRHVTVSGNRIAVHYETPAAAGIAIVDLGSGAVVSRVKIVPEGGRP